MGGGVGAKRPFLQFLKFDCMGHNFLKLMQGLFSSVFFVVVVVLVVVFSFLMAPLQGSGRAHFLKPVMHPIQSSPDKFQNPGSPSHTALKRFEFPAHGSCLSKTYFSMCRAVKRPLWDVNQEGPPSSINEKPFLFYIV